MSEKPRYWTCCQKSDWECECCGCKSCTLARKQTKQRIVDEIVRRLRKGEKIQSVPGPAQKWDTGTPYSVYFWSEDNRNLGWLHIRQVKHLMRFHGLKLDPMNPDWYTKKQLLANNWVALAELY